MIKENRIGKYMLYAIGEILLVIIGILIALNINNRNLAQQNETKFEALFKEVSKDLIAEIAETNRVLRNNIKKDSLLNLVINNKVTKEDYEKSDDFSNVSFIFSTMDFSNNGYINLSNQIDKIPKKYKKVVNKLNELYLNHKKELIYHDTRIAKIIEDIDEKWASSKTWYSGYPEIQSKKEKIEYFLNDAYYKNDARRIKYEVHEIVRVIEQYKYKAVKCYMDIAKLISPELALPKLITSYSIDISEEILKQYVGSYHREGIPVVNFSLNEGEFYWSVEGLDNNIIWNPKSDTTFVSLYYPYSMVIDKNVDSDVTGFTLKIKGVDELLPYTKLK